MSSVIKASSSPKRNSASVLASSVLPTPVGPAKIKEPPGRCGSFKPARDRRIACAIEVTASFCPITRLWSSSSIRNSFADSASVSLNTGIPVDMESTCAISSSSTTETTSRSPSFHDFSRSARCSLSCCSLSRKAAAFSKSCPSMAASFSPRTSAIFSSSSRSSGGAVIF